MFDDEYYPPPSEGGSGNTDAQDAANLAQFDNDFAESVQMALGSSSSQEWVPDFREYGQSGPSTAVYGQQPKAVNDTPKDQGGIIGKISGFVDKNKALSEMLVKGIAGAASGNQAKKTAEIQARNRLDELKLKNQQEQEANARTSASVAGLRQPVGIINRGPLRRADGTPVFSNGRIV